MKITGLAGAELPAAWREEGNYASAYMGYVEYGQIKEAIVVLINVQGLRLGLS